jgi:hypothetical protein
MEGVAEEEEERRKESISEIRDAGVGLDGRVGSSRNGLSDPKRFATMTRVGYW